MSGDPVLAALARLEAKMDERFEKIDVRFEKIEDGQTRLRVDLMERMDRFENRLVAIQEDIGVNMGAVSTLYDRQAATRREVDATGSMLHGMMRQIHRLQNDVEALRKRSA